MPLLREAGVTMMRRNIENAPSPAACWTLGTSLFVLRSSNFVLSTSLFDRRWGGNPAPKYPGDSILKLNHAPFSVQNPLRSSFATTFLLRLLLFLSLKPFLHRNLVNFLRFYVILKFTDPSFSSALSCFLMFSYF